MRTSHVRWSPTGEHTQQKKPENFKLLTQVVGHAWNTLHEVVVYMYKRLQLQEFDWEKFCKFLEK